MNIQVIQEKLALINKEGKKLSPKQIGYVEFHYDPTSEELENIIYHWKEKELILKASVDTLNSLEGIAGYDFSVESAKVYVKLENEALMIICDTDDINLFKEIFIDCEGSDEFDAEGNFIEED